VTPGRHLQDLADVSGILQLAVGIWKCQKLWC